MISATSSRKSLAKLGVQFLNNPWVKNRCLGFLYILNMSANQLMLKTLLSMIMTMIMEKYKTFWESSSLGSNISPVQFYSISMAEGVVVLLIEFAVILGWKGLPALWRNGSLSKFSCS